MKKPFTPFCRRHMRQGGLLNRLDRTDQLLTRNFALSILIIYEILIAYEKVPIISNNSALN